MLVSKNIDCSDCKPGSKLCKAYGEDCRGTEVFQSNEQCIAVHEGRPLKITNQPPELMSQLITPEFVGVIGTLLAYTPRQWQSMLGSFQAWSPATDNFLQLKGLSFRKKHASEDGQMDCQGHLYMHCASIAYLL